MDAFDEHMQDSLGKLAENVSPREQETFADDATQKRQNLQSWAAKVNQAALEREAWYRHLKRIRPELFT